MINVQAPTVSFTRKTQLTRDSDATNHRAALFLDSIKTHSAPKIVRIAMKRLGDDHSFELVR